MCLQVPKKVCINHPYHIFTTQRMRNGQQNKYTYCTSHSGSYTIWIQISCVFESHFSCLINKKILKLGRYNDFLPNNICVQNLTVKLGLYN